MRKASGVVILTTWEELWEVAMSQPWLLRYFNQVGSKIREERVAGLNDLIRVMTREACWSLRTSVQRSCPAIRRRSSKRTGNSQK